MARAELSRVLMDTPRANGAYLSVDAEKLERLFANFAKDRESP